MRTTNVPKSLIIQKLKMTETNKDFVKVIDRVVTLLVIIYLE